MSPWVAAAILPVIAVYQAADGLRVVGRGLHSSTFRLNVSASYGIGGALRGCLWCILSLKRVMLS